MSVPVQYQQQKCNKCQVQQQQQRLQRRNLDIICVQPCCFAAATAASTAKAGFMRLKAEVT
jgi:hypothetical protein